MLASPGLYVIACPSECGCASKQACTSSSRGGPLDEARGAEQSVRGASCMRREGDSSRSKQQQQQGRMWQTTWHASAGGGGGGGGGGGKGSSACSTHDFLSRYGDGSSPFSDQSSGRGGVSSLTTHDFLQPLERSTSRGGSTARDGQVPSNSDKSGGVVGGGGEPGQPRSPPAASPSADRQVPGSSNTAAYSGSSSGHHHHLVPAFSAGGHGHGGGRGGHAAAAALEASSAGNSSRKAAAAADGMSHADGGGGIRGVPFVTSAVAAAAVARDEHSVIEHSRGSDTVTDPDSSDFLARERAENLAHWSSVRMKFGMSDLPSFAAKNSSMSQNSLEHGLNPGAAYLKQWQQPSQGTSEPCRRSVKVPSEDDDDEDDEYMDKTRDMRKDSLFQKGDTAQKLDGKNGGTPRSKHSATEQRRRSKINDRFQMLRQLVPHSDQKRDKASFLLEVIEYIQILKDKVKKYESVEHGRNQDRLKSMVWDLCKRNAGAGDSTVNIDTSRLDSLVLSKEYSSPISAVSMDLKQPAQLPYGRFGGGYPVPSKPHHSSNEVPQPIPLSTMSNSIYDRENLSEAAESMPFRGRATGHHLSSAAGMGMGGAVSQEHLSHQQQQQQQQAPHGREQQQHKYYAQGVVRPSQQQQQQQRTDVLSSAHSNEDGGVIKSGAQPQQRHFSPPAYGAAAASGPRHQSPSAHYTGGAEAPQSSAASRRPPPQQQLSAVAAQEPSLQESSLDPAAVACQEPMAIQGGVINVSSAYSQGLLDTLTKALQSSGLDLSQANISVQIDLGKTTTAATSNKVTAQTPESSAQSHQSQEHTRHAVSYPEAELQHPHKRPKLEMDAS